MMKCVIAAIVAAILQSTAACMHSNLFVNGTSSNTTTAVPSNERSARAHPGPLDGASGGNSPDDHPHHPRRPLPMLGIADASIAVNAMLVELGGLLSFDSSLAAYWGELPTSLAQYFSSLLALIRASPERVFQNAEVLTAIYNSPPPPSLPPPMCQLHVHVPLVGESFLFSIPVASSIGDAINLFFGGLAAQNFLSQFDLLAVSPGGVPQAFACDALTPLTALNWTKGITVLPRMKASAGPELPQAVSDAITVQGRRLAEAIMLGLKNIENRPWCIKAGWHALHVGAAPRNKDPSVELVLDSCAELPADSESSLLPSSAIVGIFLVERTEPCVGFAGEKWAVLQPGGYCNIIKCVSRLQTPIPCPGALSLWKLPFEVASQIGAQLPRMEVLVSKQLQATYLPSASASACIPSASLSAMTEQTASMSHSTGSSVTTVVITCLGCSKTFGLRKGLQRHLNTNPVCARSHERRIELQRQRLLTEPRQDNSDDVQQNRDQVRSFRVDMRSLVSSSLAGLQLDSLCDNTLRSEMKHQVRIKQKGFIPCGARATCHVGFGVSLLFADHLS